MTDLEENLFAQKEDAKKRLAEVEKNWNALKAEMAMHTVAMDDRHDKQAKEMQAMQDRHDQIVKAMADAHARQITQLQAHIDSLGGTELAQKLRQEQHINQLKQQREAAEKQREALDKQLAELEAAKQ